VEKLVSIEGKQARKLSRHFVRAAKPALHAGVGDALRQAYDLNGAARDLSRFEDLLGRLG
jgi:hypothetical protein